MKVDEKEEVDKWIIELFYEVKKNLFVVFEMFGLSFCFIFSLCFIYRLRY